MEDIVEPLVPSLMRSYTLKGEQRELDPGVTFHSCISRDNLLVYPDTKLGGMEKSTSNDECEPTIIYRDPK